MSTRRTMLLFALALTMGCASIEQHAQADTCLDAISPETAQRLFDRIKAVSVSPGYVLDGVETKDDLAVLWSFDGKPCPPIRVGFTECTPTAPTPTLQLHVPPELATQCPGLEAVTAEIARAIVGERPAQSLPRRASPLPIVVAALAVAAVLVIRHVLAPAAAVPFGWRDLGWIGFVVAAANPLFVQAPQAVTVELAAAWLLLAVLLADRDLLALRGPATTLSLLGLFAFSLLLRWWLSSAGPGDLHLNLAAIWSPGLDTRWGSAPIALFRLLDVVVAGVRDHHIIWCNLILSSLVPVLLYAIVAQLGVSTIAALCTAFIAAAHPLLIVFSGVLERQPTYLFAACGSMLALIDFLRGGARRRFVAFILGTVLAIASRPEGAHLLMLHVAILLVVRGGRRARALVTVALGVLGALAFAYLRYTLAVRLGDTGMHAHSDQAALLWTVLLDPDFTPLAWIVAWILGLALGLRRRTAWVALLGVTGLHIVWQWTGLYDQIVGFERQVASARYQSILLVPFAIGVALLIDALRQTPRRAKAGAFAALMLASAATFRRPYETLLQPFTVDYEYRFLTAHLRTLPPAAHLYIFDSPNDDDGLYNATAIGRFVGSPLRISNWRERRCDDLLRDASATYLYIGSFCAEQIGNPGRPLPPVEYEQWMADCTAIRARLAADAVEEIQVPARKMAWHDFKDRTVRLGLYRVTDPSLCELGPRIRE